MRLALPYVLLAALALGLGMALAQEPGETKSTTHPVPASPPWIEPDLIWNFHFEGKKRDGEFLEFLAADEGRGRTLVITQIDVRTRASTRWQVIEHQPVRDGWKKVVRRSDLFSLGNAESTSQFLAVKLDGLPGMKIEGGRRPGLEFTQGSSDVAVYAEGYWASK